MKTSDLIRLTIRDISNSLQSDNTLISDSMYRAITEMQEDTYCSVYRGRQIVSQNTYTINIQPEFLGSDYSKQTPFNKFTIIPIQVEGVWKVGANESLEAIYLLDKRTIQYQRNSLLTPLDACGVVEFSGVNTVLRTPFNLNGFTLEFWLRYKIPYIQNAFTGNVIIGNNTVNIQNSLLETIPERYHDLLVKGVKYHLYNSLLEKTNTQEYEGLRQIYMQEWYNKILPRVKQESNKPIAKEVIYRIAIPNIFNMNG